MNRKWLVLAIVGVLVVVAVVALLVGGEVGRSIVPEPAPKKAQTVRFKDTLTDVSIAYPAGWVRRTPKDQAVRLVASSRDGVSGLSLSVRKSGLDPVSDRTVRVVKPLTDDLLRSDKRIEELTEPVAVNVGGLPGLRYAYTYRGDDRKQGAHLHYFLFKDQRLIQIVLQAVPASRFPALEPSFVRIATSFQNSPR